MNERHTKGGTGFNEVREGGATRICKGARHRVQKLPICTRITVRNCSCIVTAIERCRVKSWVDEDRAKVCGGIGKTV